MFGRAGGEWGDATIFTANIDGSADVRVGGFLSDKTTCCPRWSPDGRRIAAGALAPDGRFTTVLMDPDGGNAEVFELPGEFNGGCGTWSPDGARLACEGSVGDQDNSYGIYIVDSGDGDDVRPVYTDEPGYVIAPMDFSPDGTKILFLGPPVGPVIRWLDEGAPIGSLYVINLDGSGEAERITPDGLYAWVQARWSPDGEWIAFGGPGGDQNPALFLVHPDGSGLHEVFTDRRGRPATIPEWSPDGQHLIFTLNPPGAPVTLSVNQPNELCLTRADGTGLTCLVKSRDQKTWPDWTY